MEPAMSARSLHAVRPERGRTPDPTPLDPQDPREADWLARVLARHGGCRDTERVARCLLDRFGGLAAVVAADPGELGRAADLDPAAVEEIGLLRRLAVLLIRSSVTPRPTIGSWTALLDYVRVALAEEPREQFRALFLDRRNGLMRDEMIAFGTVDHAPVYPREVVRRALELSASALILVHNHPSGDPTPSRADIEMTRRIVDAARVFGLEVHDHLVVGRAGTASFKSLGLM